MKNLLSVVCAATLVYSPGSMASAEDFFCGPDNEVTFAFEEPSQFNFEGKGFTEATFIGVTFNIANIVKLKSGKPLDKTAVVQYVRELKPRTYLTDEVGWNPDNPDQLSEAIQMMGAEAFQKTTTYELELSTLKLRKVEVVIADRVRALETMFECRSANIFDQLD